MICWSICHWISDGFWSHFWCFFHTFTIRTCNLLNHQKPLFFQWISIILLFRETWFLMIFLIFSVTSFCIYFFWQKDAKMDPKSDQNETKNHPDARFLRFWGVLGGGVFRCFLGPEKVVPKSGKIRYFGPRRAPRLLTRRNARGCRRGKERFRTSPGSSGIWPGIYNLEFQDLEF